MKKLILTIAILLPSLAMASETGKTIALPNNGVSGEIALNGSQASRTTDAVKVRRNSVVRFKYDYTRVAGTDWSLYCQHSDDGENDWRNISVPNTTGAFTVDQAIYSYAALTASTVLDFRIGTATFIYIRCYPTVTAAGATDTFTTTYTLFD